MFEKLSVNGKINPLKMSRKGKLKNLIQLYETENNTSVKVKSDNKKSGSVIPVGYVPSLTAKINFETKYIQTSRVLDCIKISKKTGVVLNKQSESSKDFTNKGLSQEETSEEPDLEYTKVPVKQTVLNFEALTLKNQNKVLRKEGYHNSIPVSENSEENRNHQTPNALNQKPALSVQLEVIPKDSQKSKICEKKEINIFSTINVNQNKPRNNAKVVELTLKKGDTARKKRKQIVVRQESDQEMTCAMNDTINMVNDDRDLKMKSKTGDSEVKQHNTNTKLVVNYIGNTFATKEAIEMIKEERGFEMSTEEQDCKTTLHNQLNAGSMVALDNQISNDKKKKVIFIGDVLSSSSPPPVGSKMQAVLASMALKTDESEVKEYNTNTKQVVNRRDGLDNTLAMKEAIKEERAFEMSSEEQDCKTALHNQINADYMVAPNSQIYTVKKKKVIIIGGFLSSSSPPPVRSEIQAESNKPSNGGSNSAQLSPEIGNEVQMTERINKLLTSIKIIKKNQKMRVDELIETEKAYVNQLRRVVRCYELYIQDPGVPCALLSLDPEDVFCNIKQIYKFHSKILLPALIYTREDMEAFGNVFIKHISSFMEYELYSIKNSRSGKILRTHNTYFCEKHEEFGHDFDLLTHLTYPLQRLTRLPLFIESMLKNYRQMVEISRSLDESLTNSNRFYDSHTGDEWNQTTKYEKDLKSLERALEILVDTIKKIDLNMTLRSITGLPVDLKLGKFMRKDTFKATNHSNNQSKMKCFLFENCIIITALHQRASESEQCLFSDLIPIEFLFFTPSIEETKSSFSVQNYNTSKIYILRGEIPSVQKTWEQDITQLLWKQLQKLKEDKQSINSEDSKHNGFLSPVTSPTLSQKLLFVTQSNQNRPRVRHSRDDQRNIQPSMSDDDYCRDTARSNTSVSQTNTFQRASELHTSERLTRSYVDEILESEEEYVNYLNLLVENAIDEDPDFYLVPEKIFRNTEQIYNFHSKRLLPALKRASYDLTALADVFIEHESGFLLYNTFTNKRERSFNVVNQHKYLCREFQTKLGQHNTLATFFINPFRRISSYFLILEELVKSCSYLCDNMKESSIPRNNFDSSRSLKKLMIAKQVMKKLLQNIDDKLQLEKILYSQIDMMEQGELLRNDYFNVVDDNNRQFQMRCFLFEKILIFTVVHLENAGEYFHYHDAISINGLGLTPPRDKLGNSFTVWYQQFNSKRYTLKANTATLMEWVNDMNKILWTQLVFEKEKRRIDFAESKINTL